MTVNNNSMLDIAYISNPLLLGTIAWLSQEHDQLLLLLNTALWLRLYSFEHFRHLAVVFETSQACGPEKAENSNVNGSELRGHISEVDCLQEWPNKDTDLKIPV